MVAKMIFHIMLSVGLLVPNGEHEGREMYEVYTQDCKLVAEYAYKAEVIEYIKSGTFVYDEMFPEE